MGQRLSFTGKRWILSGDGVMHDPQELLASLAERRGHDLLKNDATNFSNPFLFAEMGMATERICAAMKNDEKIVVFGDYDADGITAAAQLARFFRRHKKDAHIHLPGRSDGYGLTLSFINQCAKDGVTLLITVDTGIAAQKEIEAANDAGIDVIVTDHHSATRGRPPAFAVIHPRVPTEFPNPHLSGSGVALFLIRALEQTLGSGRWEGMDEDLILATIGTVADLVPLTGENRTLVRTGLARMNKLPASSPLARLLRDTGKNERALTSTDIAFRIAPRINASGRIAHPSVALDAILSGGDGFEELVTLNEERKAMTGDLMKKAEEQTDTSRLFLCAMSEEFPAGIIGLLAGKMTDLFGRPSLVASCKDGTCTASLRGVRGIDLAEMLGKANVARHLLTWGGHSQAAGCTFLREKFEDVRNSLEEEMKTLGITQESLVPTIDLDTEVVASALTEELVHALRSLEPFGNGNSEPLFLLRSQRLTNARIIGTAGDHLQCMIGATKAVGFRLGHVLPHCMDEEVDVACRLQTNTWNGREELQIVIVDLRQAESVKV